MKILTYNLNLNDIVASHGYLGRLILLIRENTAVISTEINTNTFYIEDAIIIILVLQLSSEPNVILTQININLALFLEPNRAAGHIEVIVLAYSFSLDQDLRR